MKIAFLQERLMEATPDTYTNEQMLKWAIENRAPRVSVNQSRQVEAPSDTTVIYGERLDQETARRLQQF